jgi:hypothetical protein
MALPARKSQFPDDAPNSIVAGARKALAKSQKPADILSEPVMIDAIPSQDAADAALAKLNEQKLKLAGQSDKKDPHAAVVTGLRDLQQLQKQTIAVLEAVKGNLEDIRQVLRSPEATRGMEKQQNAAALLARGFAAESSAQARGAVELLPANPDAHLLLSLALAANQEFDDSLGAARKGLALFDRRQHPLAIEAGLLHAIAALGHGAEAAQRWGEIIEGLPLAVLLDHIGRIAVCYPSAAPEDQLDKTLARKILSCDEREGKISAALFLSGLDATTQHRLARSHRVIMIKIAGLSKSLAEPAEILRYLGDYVVPLAEREHGKTASALSKRAVKKLLAVHADAPTLYRALLKIELASARKPSRYLARLLAHWRSVGVRLRTRRTTLMFSMFFLLIGAGLFANTALKLQILPPAFDPIYIPFAVLGVGVAIALSTLFQRSLTIDLPHDRPNLSRSEIQFLRTREVKETLKRILRK